MTTKLKELGIAATAVMKAERAYAEATTELISKTVVLRDAELVQSIAKKKHATARAVLVEARIRALDLEKTTS